MLAMLTAAAAASSRTEHTVEAALGEQPLGGAQDALARALLLVARLYSARSGQF